MDVAPSARLVALPVSLQLPRIAGLVTRPRRRGVLVVEDALPIRRKLLESLHRAGVAAADVTLVSSPDEALESFARAHPSVVLCELIGAHPSDGIAMISEMLRIDPHARIILLTAEDPDGALVRSAIRLGVFGVVSKPLRDEKVRQVLLDARHEEGHVVRIR